MRYRNIIFDLDGTIIDSEAGITKSVQYALQKFNIIVKDLKELVSFIGPPLKESFMELYGFSEPQALQAIIYYREYYAEHGVLIIHCILELRSCSESFILKAACSI